MPNSASLDSISSAVCCNSSGLTVTGSLCGMRSKLTAGFWYSPEGGGLLRFSSSNSEVWILGGGATDTATDFLRLLLLPSSSGAGAAVIVLASLTMRRVFFASGSSVMTPSCFFANSLRNSPTSMFSVLRPVLAITSSQETCASNDTASSRITAIINRLPDLPNSQLKPVPATAPTKPPAPTGRRSPSVLLRRKNSKIGLQNNSNSKAMPAIRWL